MDFQIKLGELPESAKEFDGPISPGDSAIVVQHPSGPWTTSAYTKIDPNEMRIIGKYSINGVYIELGETTSKGSTVQPDGTVVNWERPAIAYAPSIDLDTLEDAGTDTVYIFPESNRAGTTGELTDQITNESYEIKRVQTLAAACLAAFMHQLGGKYPPRTGDAWTPAKYEQFLNGDLWRKDSQRIYFHHDPNDHRKSEYVEFDNVFYGPESDFIEGTPVLVQNVELEVDGLTKIFDNSAGKDPVTVEYIESVTLANAVTETVGESFTFDVTTSSETTVGGSYAGASLEQKLSVEVHSGFSKDESREESESKEETNEIKVSLECPVGAIKEVKIVKKHQRENIPVSGLFVIDSGVTMKLRHWWNKDAGGVGYRNGGQDYFTAPSVQGLYELMLGLDTDYPNLEDFWQDKGACQREVRDGMLHSARLQESQVHVER